MRLHYDRTLPSVAERLTKDKGQTVDLGLHKEVAKITDQVRHNQQIFNLKVVCIYVVLQCSKTLRVTKDECEQGGCMI
jgi:hypothetical protein